MTEIVKDSGYDSADTENTLYDGYETTLKKNNFDDASNSLESAEISKKINNNIDDNKKEEIDVFEKYNLQCLKGELEEAENKKFQIRLRKNKFDLLLSPFFYTVLLSIHVVYTIYIYSIKILSHLQNIIAIKKFQLTPKTLSLKTSYLKKIPKHLSFIIQIQSKDIQDSTILFNNIKNLIYWSMEVGIPNISFYDYNGYLKQHISEIVSTFEKRVNFPASPKLNIQFSRSGSKVTSLTIFNNYILNNSEKQKALIKDFTVNFISYDDGKPHLAKMATLLSKTMKSNEVSKMTIEDMDQFILENSGEAIETIAGRDPELIIIYGGTSEYFQLYGYPPWQIRLSEIYYVPGKPDITYSGFINGLFRYSRCEQRLGK